MTIVEPRVRAARPAVARGSAVPYVDEPVEALLVDDVADPEVDEVESRPLAAPVVTRPARPRVAKPLELVEPNAWRSRRRLRLLGALLAFVMVLAPFAIVALHVMMAQQQFDLQRINTQLDQATRRNQNLRELTDQNSSAQSIVSKAMSDGLIMPPKVTPIPVPASAAPSPADGSVAPASGGSGSSSGGDVQAP